MYTEIFFTFIGALLILGVYLRHSKIPQMYADNWHDFCSRHPIISELFTFWTPEVIEREMRRRNKSKFVSALIIIFAVLLFLPAFLSIWSHFFYRNIYCFLSYRN